MEVEEGGVGYRGTVAPLHTAVHTVPQTASRKAHPTTRHPPSPLHWRMTKEVGDDIIVTAEAGDEILRWRSE